MHTLEVVQNLLNLDEFNDLTDIEQGRTELAAFLHDIGKGPKARWVKNGGLQKVDPDHPVSAMPMMVEIFLEHIQISTAESAKAILKLVCYHDLFGEVLGKERDEQQIVNAVSNVSELKMLYALGKADATALNPTWWNDDLAHDLFHRCESAIVDKMSITE